MEDIWQGLYDWFKRFSPYLLFGALGALVHRLRNNMTWKAFWGSLFISVLVSLSVGVVCQEYTSFADNIIFVLCGISGVFSKLLLDEIEEVISDLSEYFRQRIGMKKAKKKNKNNQDIPDEK